MSVRSEREKSKMQEKYQTILAQMLKEDDNRFCVDCDTKSNKNNYFQIYYYDLFSSFEVQDGLVGILVFSFVFVVLVFIEI
jgi:hypothetical protein